jgi:hypothetical protein
VSTGANVSPRPAGLLWSLGRSQESAMTASQWRSHYVFGSSDIPRGVLSASELYRVDAACRRSYCQLLRAEGCRVVSATSSYFR